MSSIETPRKIQALTTVRRQTMGIAASCPVVIETEALSAARLLPHTLDERAAGERRDVIPVVCRA
jgi:hypothetical protein